MERLTFASATALSLAVLAAANAAGAETQSGAGAKPPEATSTGAGMLEEITVTARRRAESTTDVPIAVSAFSNDALIAKGVLQTDDLQRATPSLRFTPSAGRRSNSTYAIRGIATTESLITQDPAVGIYVNDVYLARATGTNQSFYDIDSVQVLYGPQGTLFGRNSTAGAVLINTKKPTDQIEGEFSAGYGNLGRYEATGIVNLPVSDTLAIRVAAQRIKRDGYGRDITNNVDIADNNTTSARLSVLWKPADGVENSTVVSYFSADENGSLNVLTGLRGCTPAPLPPPNNILAGSPPGSCLYSPTGDAILHAGNIFNQFAAQQARDPYHVAYDPGIDTYERPQTITAANTTTWTLSDQLTLKNIVGYNGLKFRAETELDATSIKIIDTFLDSQVDQYSEELQLQGDHDRFNWIVGGLYFNERGRDIQISTQLAGLNPTNPQKLNTVGVNKSYALFAQGTYKLMEGLSLTAGARYSRDEREVTYDHPTSSFGTPQARCAFAAATAPDCLVNLEKSFDKPTYTVSLDYKLTSDSLVYLATRQGYRAGGYNARATNEIQLTPFTPETIRDVEAGYKADLRISDSATLRTGIAVYRAKYDDIQRQVSVDPDGAGPIPQSTNVINAAAATIDGFELNVGLGVGSWLDVSAFWGYVDGQFDEFEDGGVIYRDVSFPSSNDSLGATVALTPIDRADIGRVTLTTAYSYRSESFGDTSLPRIEPESRIGPQRNVNVLLDWDSIFGSELSAGVWMRNATDEETKLGVIGLATTLGLAISTYGEPRTYGATLKYKFGLM